MPEIIKQARKDMVNIGSCHPAFTGMNEVLQKNTNIYAEDEPEDFGRERNKKADYVYFAGCVGLYREDEATEATLDLLDRLDIDYTLWTKYAAAACWRTWDMPSTPTWPTRTSKPFWPPAPTR